MIAIAEIRSMHELHMALRARAEDLQVTRLSLDEVSGLQAGYCGKLLSRATRRTIGMMTLGPILTALGVKLLLAEDCEAARYVSRLEKRRVRINADDSMPTIRKRGGTRFLGNSAWGRAMRATAYLKQTPRERRRLARVAAKARWSRR